MIYFEDPNVWNQKVFMLPRLSWRLFRVLRLVTPLSSLPLIVLGISLYGFHGIILVKTGVASIGIGKRLRLVLKYRSCTGGIKIIEVNILILQMLEQWYWVFSISTPNILPTAVESTWIKNPFANANSDCLVVGLIVVYVELRNRQYLV